MTKSKSTSSLLKHQHNNNFNAPLLPPSFFCSSSHHEKLPQESREDDPIQQDEVDSSSGSPNVNNNNTIKKRVPYTMSSEPRGKCVIFNNTFHTQRAVYSPDGHTLPWREGSDIDVITLEEVFSWLHFNVNVYENLDLSRMKEVLGNISCADCHGDHDAFVCFILSHGFENGIYTSDGQQLLLSDVKKCFTGDRATELHGKPKLFFIQACQGANDNTGRVVETDSPLNRSFPPHPPPKKSVQSNSVSSDADMLLCLATTPGYH